MDRNLVNFISALVSSLYSKSTFYLTEWVLVYLSINTCNNIAPEMCQERSEAVIALGNHGEILLAQSWNVYTVAYHFQPFYKSNSQSCKVDQTTVITMDINKTSKKHWISRWVMNSTDLPIILLSPVLIDRALFIASKRVLSSSFMFATSCFIQKGRTEFSRMATWVLCCRLSCLQTQTAKAMSLALKIKLESQTALGKILEARSATLQ